MADLISSHPSRTIGAVPRGVRARRARISSSPAVPAPGTDDTLNVLSSALPDDERIITVEDAAELQLKQDHVITLESRPANIEGKGQVTIRDLVRNTLRMRPRPDRRRRVPWREAVDMLQAMNTGHDGSLTTIHANNPRDALCAPETLVLTAGVELPLQAIREQIASAFDLIVQVSRLVDGTRTAHARHRGPAMQSDVVTLQERLPRPRRSRTAHQNRDAGHRLLALDLHGHQAALPGQDGLQRRQPAAELLQEDPNAASAAAGGIFLDGRRHPTRRHRRPGRRCAGSSSRASPPEETTGAPAHSNDPRRRRGAARAVGGDRLGPGPARSPSSRWTPVSSRRTGDDRRRHPGPAPQVTITENNQPVKRDS